jgi:Short C-terminal domain
VFGHKWEPAEGTVVEYRQAEHVYVMDVRKANGQVERATVKETAGLPLPAGTTVRLEVNPKTGETRIDPNAGNFRAGSVRDAMKLAEQVRRAQKAGGGAAAAAAAALSGLPQGICIQQGLPGQPGAPGMRVVSGGEAAELVQELFSGNSGDRAAAIERLKNLRSGMGTQAAGPAGMPDPVNPAGGFNTPPPPSTFDPVGGFNTPPPPSTFDPVGSFNTPPPPSTFDPVGGFNTPPPPSTFDPVGGFSTPPPPSTFDPVGGIGTSGSFGQPSAADRIAKLQDLRDKGLITTPEFEVQRQRILDEI